MTAKNKNYGSMRAGQIALSVVKYALLIGLAIVALVPLVWTVSS